MDKIEEKINKNKRSKNSANTTSEKKYFQFIVFCQSQNFSLKQISTLGKYLKEIVIEKKAQASENNTFDREGHSCSLWAPFIKKKVSLCALKSLRRLCRDSSGIKL